MKASEWLETLPAKYCEEREQAILDAVRAGHAVIDWSTIETSEDWRTLRIEVSSDVLRIGEPGDSVRVAVSAYLQQLICDQLDCALPTPDVSDLIWARADHVLGCYTQQPCTADTAAFVKHSQQLDRELAGRSGLSTAGKDWVLIPGLLSNGAAAGSASNYGWHRASGSPWQPVGRAHNAGTGLGSGHTDYSQFCRLLRRRCWLGDEQTTVDAILSSSATVGLLSSLGAIPEARLPCCPRQAPDTEPSGVHELPWQDAMLSLGERCVLWSQNERQAGVCEQPAGSNTGPRIRDYLYPCVRDGRRLRLTSGHWCAASACAAQEAALLFGEAPVHTYRASGYELQHDAVGAGSWRPAELVREGSWEPQTGDLCILSRGTGSWRRHVCRVVSYDGPTMLTIGGNERDQWMETMRSIMASDLLGFIEYPRRTPTPLDAWAAARMVEMSRSVMDGEPSLADVMAAVDRDEGLSVG